MNLPSVSEGFHFQSKLCRHWVGFKGKYISHCLFANPFISTFLQSMASHVICSGYVLCVIHCFLQMTLPPHYPYQLMYREWWCNWLLSFRYSFLPNPLNIHWHFGESTVFWWIKMVKKQTTTSSSFFLGLGDFYNNQSAR